MSKGAWLVRFWKRGISMCRPQAASLWLAGFLLGQILAGGVCARAYAQPTETPEPPPASAQQPPEKTDKPEKKPVAGPPTPASELDTYLLRDSKGNLVPVIGLSFEDFEKLLQIQKGLAPPPPPPFSIDSLTVTGKADGFTAELQVAATVRVRQDGWVRVPLRLGGTALLEPAKHQGPGEHVLNVGSEGEGYLLWLKGQGKSHQVQLRLAVPITEAGPERRLQLNLPRGTESAVRLQVPFGSVAASLRNASEGILSTKSLANNQSEIVVVGPTGDLQIGWQRGRASAADIKPTLDATGEITVRVESRNRLSAEARLKLRAVGKPLEMVAVRLPPGMQLVPAPTTGYTLAVAEGDSNKPNTGVLVDVRFDRPTTGPVEIRLLAEQEVSPNMADISLRPARFEVIGAQRQRGGVDFVVEGDWNLNWSDENSTRRVELTDTLATTGRPVARFEYYKQPLDLKLSVTPRPTRVAVEPQYHVFVDATQLRLEAAFRFRIRGPKATSTNLDLAGWRIDSVVGENATEQPLPPAEGSPMLQLPLAQIDLAKGELTYRITAHQPLPVETTSVKFSLPRPQVDTSAPASISVQPADNVELTPVVADLKGLVADTTAAAPASSAVPLQHAPLLYRDLGSAEAISFVGSRRVRSRHISLQTESLIKLKRGPVEVEQRLDYQIAYEGKRSYLLELPAGLAEPKALQILQGTQLLEHRPAPVVEDGPNLIEVLDTQSRLGRVQLTVRYTLPTPVLKAEPATMVHIPLITPAAGEIDRFTGQSVRVEHAEELRLTVPVSRAPDSEELLPSERGVLAGKTDQQLTALDLNVSLLQTPEISGLVIDRLWMQSWLSPQQRQDRSVFQFRTAAVAVVVRLPVAIADSNVQILLNGKGVSSTTSGERSVRIELPASPTPQTNVVELWYKLRRTASPWIADHRLTPPQIELPNSNQRIQPQRLQWQVILPSHEHLLFDPADYAPEMKWAWRNYYWSRVAMYDQRWLEDWCGASRQEPLPAALNSYLYSTVGSEPELQLRTMGQRALAVSLASLGLLLGLLVLHVPQVRSSTGLLILAAILLGLGFAAPQTMLFVAQIFGLGLVIVAVIAALRWLWTGQVAATPLPMNRANSNLSGPRSTGSRSSPPMTTAAAPVLPPSPQEVES